MTKFGRITCVGRSICLRGQHTPNSKGRCFSDPKFGGSFLLMHSHFVKERPNLTLGGVFMHWVMQPRLPTQVSGVPGIPNFGVLLYLCPHPLTLNNQIWQDMGVLGQQLGLRPTLCWESLQRSPRPSSRLGSAPPILCLRFCRTIFISVAPQNKILLLPSHYSSLTPTYWGHMPVFVPRPLGHACCDHNESESYRPTIICRHCVDQQTDSLVFSEVQSDHME